MQSFEGILMDTMDTIALEIADHTRTVALNAGVLNAKSEKCTTPMFCTDIEI